MCWVAQSHLEEGRNEEAILTARMMFRNGLSMEMVSACVQRLSPEKLQEIYREENPSPKKTDDAFTRGGMSET